jgi:hypothetical protein
MAIVRAERLEQVYKAFRNEPLRQEDFAFYCDTEKARGTMTRKRLERHLRENTDTDEHILFVGYKGCGKSTELNRLEKDLSDQFLVLNISVQRELDPVNVQYIELFIVTMEQLFSKANEYNIPLRGELLKSIKNWTQSEAIEEIREKYLGAEVEAGGGVDVSYFLNFFAKFKLAAKSSVQLKTTLQQNVEPRLGDLIAHCNDLIREIKLGLKSVGKEDMLIIIEDLDKIPLDRAQDLFYNYTNQLVLLQTNVIYTFPIALYYHVRFNQIKSYFARIQELPMIAVSTPEGADDPEGMDILNKITSARMDTALFDQPELLAQLIRKSGGVLRDLFLLINEAADSALDHDRHTISTEDGENALDRLRKDYENNIADKKEGDKIAITAAQYYDALVTLAQSPDKKIDNTEAVLDLRQNLAILGYNGKGWFDVHPMVKEILHQRRKI